MPRRKIDPSRKCACGCGQPVAVGAQFVRFHHNATRTLAPGERFGRWTVIAASQGRQPLKIYRCRCECGVERDIPAYKLVSGKATRCTACAHSALATHGHTRGTGTRQRQSGEYMSWRAMVRRCTSPTEVAYANYGGRGIRVHRDWIGQGGFARFLAHIGPRPSREFTIDRINGDGHYEPGNVRWATRADQIRNSRTAKMITIGDTTLCIKDWAARSGLLYHRARRLLKSGLPPEEVFKAAA